ncbi:glycoside hydrolase/deacetylase [Pelomyxa schiedti]|nr:glycoside hydrolase/deacetylase [Pelomyxa schiedti]
MCLLPNCKCCDIWSPQNMSTTQTPQFVVLTFDDAQESAAAEVIFSILRLPPDRTGCRVGVTIFLTDEYTDYDVVRREYSLGAEIASHTFTHMTGSSTAVDEWIRELTLSRAKISKELGITQDKIVGFRAPNLEWSSSTFEALVKERFLYDASLGNRQDAWGIQDYVWPCSMNYGLPAMGGAKGQMLDKKFRGLFEFPLYVFTNPVSDMPSYPMDPAEGGWSLLELLKHDFHKHYDGRRSPFGIWMHPGWLTAGRFSVLKQFLEYVRALPGEEIVRFVQHPKTITQLTATQGLCHYPSQHHP